MKEIKEESRIWVVPENDLEAKTIIEMLKREGEKYFVTGQTWGASWENLEEDIKSKVEKALKEGKKVYGVELQGDSKGAKNIDHHIYGDDDRSNTKSSIEQVAEILDVELSLDEKFVSANDKDFIPGMEKLGKELGLSEKDLKKIITNIRIRDRQMQGVKPEHEAVAEEAVEKLGSLEEKRDIIVKLSHSKTSTITDRLFGKYDNLLVLSEDGETNFFGYTEIINMLDEKFKVTDENGRSNCWKGGNLEGGNGFWGGYADQAKIEETIQKAFAERARAKSEVKK